MEQKQDPQLKLPEINIQAHQVGQMLNSPTLPKIYANGFVTGKSQADVFIIPLINGNPLTILNMSFQTAKGLNDFLTKSILDIEKKLGHEIKSLPKEESK